MNDRVKDLALNHFHTDTVLERGEIHVRMHGNADSEARDGLQTLLHQLDVEAKRLKSAAAVLDLQDLYFMNSSCLSLLVRWITDVAKHQPAPYQLRFVSNASLRWQKRSLSALASLAPGLVVVVDGRSRT